MSRVDLRFARAGEGGEPLLLLDEGPDPVRVWSACATRLARAGFDAITPWLRREVGDAGPPCAGAGAAAGHGADLHRLLRDRLRVERVSVVAGGSAGAAAQALSLRFPGFVERLVLWSCPLPPAEEPNPTPALLLVPLADSALDPDWELHASRAFPDHAGPLRLPGVGRRVPLETPERLCAEIARFAGPRARETWAEAQVAYVGLGSNLGGRERRLCGAAAALRATPGIRGVVVSPVYETRAVGPGAQGPYLNAVARLETHLPPRALLERLLAIERAQGRVRGPERNAARTLDLDLLLFGALRIHEPGLQVPHPRLHERAFVLEPLRDLAPGLVHPVLGEPVEVLARRARDPEAVRRRDI